MNANIIFVPAERVVKPVGDIGQRRRSCQRVASMRVRYPRIPLEWTAALLAQSKAECVLTSAQAYIMARSLLAKTKREKKRNTFASFRSKLPSILIKNGLD